MVSDYGVASCTTMSYEKNYWMDGCEVGTIHEHTRKGTYTEHPEGGQHSNVMWISSFIIAIHSEFLALMPETEAYMKTDAKIHTENTRKTDQRMGVRWEHGMNTRAKIHIHIM